MSFSTRTLFLFIRGVDQTGRALEQPRRKLTELQKAQQDLARSSYRLLFAGAAFTSFAAMTGRAVFGLLENTERGVSVMEDFGRVVDRIKGALAEEILDQFGDTIEGWIDKLDKLSQNETFMKLAGGLLFEITTDLTILGLGALGVGLLGKLLSALGAPVWILSAVQQGGLILITIALGIKFALQLADWIWGSEAGKQLQQWATEISQELSDRLGQEVEVAPRSFGFPKFTTGEGELITPEGEVEPMSGIKNWFNNLNERIWGFGMDIPPIREWTNFGYRLGEIIPGPRELFSDLFVPSMTAPLTGNIPQLPSMGTQQKYITNNYYIDAIHTSSDFDDVYILDQIIGERVPDGG